MTIYRVAQVFVPGGMPLHTYIARSERKLEERLRAANDNLCKLITVTGATKSGKTVLTSKIFPRANSIWIDGGAIRQEDDLWTSILETLEGYNDLSVQATKETGTTLAGKLDAGVQIPLIKMGGEVSSESHEGQEKSETKSLSLSPRPAAIAQLRKKRKPLIIDDFHYLSRDFQGNIIRALKPLIFEGLPVIFIAIPHRRYDAVKVEREMTGRLESIQIPTWEPYELLKIPHEGFSLLNITIATDILPRLAAEAYGSPHLMQEFCKELCKKDGIEETQQNNHQINTIDDSLFIKVAEGTGKVIFDKLSKGPRQRSDRLQRVLKKGGTADIYEVVLYALAKLAPGLDTIEYEQLRGAIREVLADTTPKAHEVTRVLEKMAEIAAGDESSTPVLDWEKQEQKLHIMDPFFAFYLKWGLEGSQPSH